MRNPGTQLIVTIIGSIAAIFVAIIQFQPWKQDSSPEKSNRLPQQIAGRVVDQTNNNPIKGAEITVTGRAESAISEDNGNFRISIPNLAQGEIVRISTIKSGYITADRSTSIPAENLIILLKRK
jgi:hypothetical protein